MPVKCYTRVKNSGAKYVTCEEKKQLRRASGHHKPGPKKGSTEAKKVMAKARAAQSKPPSQHRYNLRRR